MWIFIANICLGYAATAGIAFEHFRGTIAGALIFIVQAIRVTIAAERFRDAATLSGAVELIIVAVILAIGFVTAIGAVIETITLPEGWNTRTIFSTASYTAGDLIETALPGF